MGAPQIDWWPDLYFGPINLWTAPWLGRRYEEVSACIRQATHIGVPKENERHLRMNAILSAMR